MRRKLLEHLLPLGIFTFIAVVLFRDLIGSDGVIINGDLVRPSELSDYSGFFYPMWNEHDSTPSMTRLPQMLFFLPLVYIGIWLGWTTMDLIVAVFLLTQVMMGLTMFYAARYILGRSYKDDPDKVWIASLMAGIMYSFSLYIVYLILHPAIRVAYALAPLMLLLLLRALDQRRYRELVAAGLVWSVACGDVHWMVYGGILGVCTIGFYAILRGWEARGGGMKEVGKALGRHVISVLVLIGSFVGFSAYWFVPGVLTRGGSVYGVAMSERSLEVWHSDATMERLLTNRPMMHSPMLFNAESAVLNEPVVQALFLLLGVVVPTLAVLALWLGKRNRYLAYLSLALVVWTFLTVMITLAPQVGFWLVLKAPLHGLFGWAFRTPKVSEFVALCFALLSGFSLFEILRLIDRKGPSSVLGRKVLSVGMLSVVLLSVTLPLWSVFTGDMNDSIDTTEMPKEFSEANAWLEEQDGDFKVLWLPEYNSRTVKWNGDHRTKKDIAGYDSSRPTYVFDTPHLDPSGFGEYVYESMFNGVNDRSFIRDGGTENLGMMMAPLGVRYLLVHDDGAVQSHIMKKMLSTLDAQEDLELVANFGLIYIYENLRYEPGPTEDTRFYTTSRDHLVYGGLASMDSLGVLPGTDFRRDGIIYAEQMFVDPEDPVPADDIVLTKEMGLEEIAFSFVEDEYVIRPFIYTARFKDDSPWRRSTMADLMKGGSPKGNLEAWDWDYGSGIVDAYYSGRGVGEMDVSEGDLMFQADFDMGLDGFKASTPGLDLSRTDDGKSGMALNGTVPKGDREVAQIASSDILPLREFRTYRFTFEFATEDAVNAQVLVRWFGNDGVDRYPLYFVTKSGTNDHQYFERDVTFPADAVAFQIQVIAEQNPTAVSNWSLDDLRTYDMSDRVVLPSLDMDATIDREGDLALYVRCLRGGSGGRFSLTVDDQRRYVVDTINVSSTFEWVSLGTIHLTEGDHALHLENMIGYNAVNLIVLVPPEKMDGYMNKARTLVSDKRIIHVLEAEYALSDIQGSGVIEADRRAGRGMSVRIGKDGASLPVEVVRAGDYGLSLRLAGGANSNALNISIGDHVQTVDYEKESGFYWVNTSSLALEEGVNLIVLDPISTEEIIFHCSFEALGYDIRTNWSEPGKAFEHTIDDGVSSDGNRSLKMTTNTFEDDTKGWTRGANMSVEPRSRYSLALDVRTENVNGTQVKVIGTDESTGKNMLLDIVIMRLSGDNAWERYGTRFTVPQDVTRVSLVLDAGTVRDPEAGNGTNWFDNIVLKRILDPNAISLDMAILFNDTSQEGVGLQDLFGAEPTARLKGIKKVGELKYELKVSATGPFTLAMAETFEGNWVAHIDGQSEITAFPLHGMLYGFNIDKAGEYTIIVEYAPQAQFEIGATVTVAALLGAFGYFMFLERKRALGVFGKKRVKRRKRGGGKGD